MRLVVHKILHWEYWPTYIIYFLPCLVYLYYAFRAKNICYYSLSNPGFKNGGLVNISKKDIYDKIPQNYYPKTILVHPCTLIETDSRLNDFNFPFIVKPDKGLRGIKVKKIESITALQRYHEAVGSPYLIQELVQLEKEIGVFYVKHPQQSQGRITGIVEKEFLTVVGDGMATIEQLLRLDKRYGLQLPALKKDAAINLKQIVPKHEKRILVPFGNHNRGTLFLDAGDKITPRLTQTINGVCQQIKGFNYGRIDLKFSSWDELENGSNFSIIEINGALSEPAHMYDPKYGFFRGVCEIIRHYKLMYEIAMENAALGHPPMRFLEGVKEINSHFKAVARLRRQT